jgi:hypothetical protein
VWKFERLEQLDHVALPDGIVVVEIVMPAIPRPKAGAQSRFPWPACPKMLQAARKWDN